MKLAVTFLSALVLATAPALAQDNAAIKRCRSIGDAAARLSCYDAIKLDEAAPVAPVAAATAARPAAPAMAAAPAPAPQTPASLFGLERKSAEPEAVESEVKGTFEGWGARTIIRFANGQAWQIDDGSNASYNLQDPKVRVRRGLMGAYYLEIAGANRSPRVKRVQ